MLYIEKKIFCMLLLIEIMPTLFSLQINYFVVWSKINISWDRIHKTLDSILLLNAGRLSTRLEQFYFKVCHSKIFSVLD